MFSDGMGQAPERPLRVLINALSAVLGGGNTVAQQLTRSLARQCPDHRFLLLCTHEDVAGFDYPGNVEVLHRPDLLPRALRWIWEQTRQPRLVRERSIDVVLVLGGYVSFRTGAPQVAVWQNSNVFSPPGIPRPFSETLLAFAQRVVQSFSMHAAVQNVFLTRNSIDLASHWWNMDHVRHCVIHSGVELDRGCPEDSKPLSERQPVILSAGSIYSHKNYEMMIDAMAEYRSRYGDPPRLEIVGAPANVQYFDSLRQRIRRLDLEDCVEMVGHVPRELVLEKMARARVYLVTSLLETFGLTLLEAMGNGLPVVASNATCHPEVGGDAVLYCDPNDPNDIAQQLHRILHDEELAQRLRENGFERLRHFSWQRSAAHYVAELKVAADGERA